MELSNILNEDSAELIFKILDTDNDGLLSIYEVCIALKALEINADEESILNNVLKNGWKTDNNKINFDIFKKLVLLLSPVVSNEKIILKSFEILDKNNKDFVTLEDISSFIKESGLNISSEDLDLMFKFGNCKDKGYITKSDFLDIIQRSENYYFNK